MVLRPTQVQDTNFPIGFPVGGIGVFADSDPDGYKIASATIICFVMVRCLHQLMDRKIKISALKLSSKDFFLGAVCCGHEIVRIHLWRSN